MCFGRAFVVVRGGPKEAKIYKELRTAARDPFSQLVGRLSANVRLFLEVNMTERVILEFRRDAVDMFGKDIKLMFTQ